MAIIRLKEIQTMSSEDREAKLVDLRAELARIKTMVKAGGAVDNPAKVREIRRTIAQILTVENEFKLGIRKGADEEEKPKKKAEKPAKKPKAEEETEETTSQ
jgi:large subunit ribosomal protein L29